MSLIETVMFREYIDKLADEVAVWEAHNFPNNTTDEVLFGIFEEAGELAHVRVKSAQGIRIASDNVQAKKIDAVADLFIYLVAYCRREGIDLGKAISDTWYEVRKRDWVKYPKNGRTS